MNKKEINDLTYDKKGLVELFKKVELYEDNIIIQMYLSLINEISDLKVKIESKERETKTTGSYFDLFPFTMRRISIEDSENEINNLEQDKKTLLKLLKEKDIYEDNTIIQMYLSLINEINALKDKTDYEERQKKREMSYFDIFPFTMRRKSIEDSENDDTNILVKPKNRTKKL